MRIGSVNYLKNSNVSYKRKIAIPTTKIIERPFNIEDSLLLGTKCLTAIGIMTATTALVLKGNNINLIKLSKNGVNTLNKKLSDNPSQTRIIKLLNGKRDEEGVKLYNVFISQKKKNSLTDKILNGTLNVKSINAYKHIVKNSIKLQRKSNAI